MSSLRRERQFETNDECIFIERKCAYTHVHSNMRQKSTDNENIIKIP